ncbi:MAG TPA: energy transducer TonB [Candidatus Dormibacteraeota bacterium]|nr:energy transducer TonB [Candidatus Dormibacteraeota bacterium]
MPRSLRFLLLSLLLIGVNFAYADDLNRQLHDRYANRTFLLRGFYSGDQLGYNSQGEPFGGATPGDWTTDGFVHLDDIRVSGHTLKIKAKRLLVVADKNGFHFRGEENPKKHKKATKGAAVEIEAELGPGSVPEQVDTFLSRTFLNPQDSFTDAVPGFWKPCISEGLSGSNEGCRFSPEMTAVPGIASSAAATPPPTRNATSEPKCPPGCDDSAASSGRVFHVGQGVKPPRALFQPNPAFSEPARQAKYQGTLTLGLIVDEEGHPTNIHVLSPLGAGLEVKAVQTVETWKFQPAEKDGQPVRVGIAVEVDFHLY